MVRAQRHAHRCGLYYTHSADSGRFTPTVSLRRLAPPSDRRPLPQGGRRVRAGHPWIYRSRRHRCRTPTGGDVVEVRDSRGALARPGAVQRRSQITLRMLTARRATASIARSGATGSRRRLRSASRCGSTPQPPARARRRRPAAVAHRRPLRRRASSCRRCRRAPTACRELIVESLVELLEPRGILRATTRRCARSKACEQEVACCYGEVPEQRRGQRRAA